MAEPPRQPVLPEFATIPMWREVSGMARTRTYEELAAGNLRGVKCGRVVLIDVKYGLEWLRSLPPVEIRPRTKPRRRDVPPVSSVPTAPVAQVMQPPASPLFAAAPKKAARKGKPLRG